LKVAPQGRAKLNCKPPTTSFLAAALALFTLLASPPTLKETLVRKLPNRHPKSSLKPRVLRKKP